MQNILRFGALIACSVLVKAQLQSPAPPLYPSGAAAPVVELQYVATNQTASISSVNLNCPSPSQGPVSTSPGALIQTSSNISAQTAVCPAGLYRAVAFLQNTVGTNGGGTVLATFAYHASGASKSAQIGSTLTESTGNVQVGTLDFWHDGSTALTLSTTQSSTGNYDLYFSIVRIQ